MANRSEGLKCVDVSIDAAEGRGPLEVWRHALSHGGINTNPLPTRVAAGLARLKPRLIRLFIQESFAIYPDHGRFDWSLLDPYMESVAQTGAKIVAAITIKPPVLFPAVDHAIWRPNHPAEWQQVVRELVKRYSVDRPMVTHWEIGNETDIGETGGSPYLIPKPDDYFEFYRTAIEGVLDAWPEAKVGGPAACWVDNEPLPGLIRLCRETGTQLDFISWHLYDDDPGRHALGVEKAKALLGDWPARSRPEMFITEWSKSFEEASYEEMAFESRRAAATAAAVLAMTEAEVDWSFYYHVWDQCFYPDSFRPFFSEAGMEGMVSHWNRKPHRFGLFGVGEEVRPQYFVYQMLGQLGEERLATACEHRDVRVLAARGDGTTTALLVNFSPEGSADVVAGLQVSGLAPGVKDLTVHRLDASRRWDGDALELRPVEQRRTYAPREFGFQILLPADSVALVTLEDV